MASPTITEPNRAVAPTPVLLATPLVELDLAPQPDPPKRADQRTAPFQLTASDGTGLQLASVNAEATIEDPLALTELHLRFVNLENRTLEGRFTFTLPEGAAMSRFSMRVDGQWQEAEVVEKQRARVAYEDFLHRRTDPALLEQGAGNEFAVRIFPIGPRATREIIVTYSETLRAGAPYRMRFAGLPTVGELTARVHSGGAVIATRALQGEPPADDLFVPSASWARGDAAAVRAGDAVVARIRVPAEGATADPFESATVLVDTSASRALDLDQEIALVSAFATSLPAEAPLVVAAFDQSVEPVFDGLAGELDESALTKLRERAALGASDLAGALEWAASDAKARPAARRRLVVLSDGVITAGKADRSDLSRRAHSLAAAGFVRADAVAVGGIREAASLEAITKGNLEASGVVVGLEEGHEVVLRKLTTRTLPPMPLRVAKAAWSHPTSVEVQPGDEVVVFARGVPVGPLKTILGKHAIEPALVNAPGPLVERAVGAAKIAELESGPGASSRRSEIVALSVKHRVVSRYTSMLVLETDADFARFKIDRNGKSNVLTVADGRATVLSEPRVAATSGATVKATARDVPTPSGLPPAPGAEAAGQGSSGALRVSHRSRPPQVRMGATSVSGRLPPESVQGDVRRNFGRFRRCYEAGLLQNPTLEGRVVVRFVIGRDGSVTSAADAGSDLPHAGVRACVVRAFLGLSFPQPEGGIITVTYPIVFTPDGGGGAPPSALPMPRPMAHHSGALELAQVESRAREEARKPYTGRFGEVMWSLDAGAKKEALELAWKWRAEEPLEVLSFVALGEAAEANDDLTLASRAYGSILELWSYRVDMRRLAGQRLERVGDTASVELAAHAYDGAVKDRPDHPSGYHLKAMALLRLGRPAEAFSTLEAALAGKYAAGRFSGALDLLRQDLGIAGAAWAKREPLKKAAILGRLHLQKAALETEPSLRFVLVWETDVNDVDLHVRDHGGEHAYYSHPTLASGGKLSADVTNGYGPEAFIIPGAESGLAFPYKLSVNYYSRGAMGFGMGKVQIVRHDGAGGVALEERPFVIMKDGLTVDLGEVAPSPIHTASN